MPEALEAQPFLRAWLLNLSIDGVYYYTMVNTNTFFFQKYLCVHSHTSKDLVYVWERGVESEVFVMTVGCNIRVSASSAGALDQ